MTEKTTQKARQPRTVHRATLPVDDAEHVLPCALMDVVHVDCRRHDLVEVWHEVPVTGLMRVVVTGTGQRVPGEAVHVGSVLSPATGTTGFGSSVFQPRGELVWHLWRLEHLRLPSDAGR